MKVLKFGGTSVGTVASLRNVKNIVESQPGPVVVVVSALGGVTDMLIDAARKAASGSNEWRLVYDKILMRHEDVVFGLVAQEAQEKVWESVRQLLHRLRDYYRGIELVEDLSARTLCKVVSFGERISSLVISHIITGARHYDSLNFIKTENWFGRDIADTELTSRLITATFNDLEAGVAIVPGFISTDRDNGDITNLGRGGSDYTAALIAAALGASVLEIWTDVDGFMTADPRIIKSAYVIPHLSFLESMDLCNFGAKVIYPPTIYPVFHKNIPIKILNTFHPDAPGTLITDTHRTQVPQSFRGVSSITDVSLISLKPNVLFPSPALRNRALNVMSKKGVDILLSTHPESDDTVLEFALRREASKYALECLRQDFDGECTLADIPEITETHDVSTVTVVGENLKSDASAMQRVIHTLQRHGIEVFAHAPGSSAFAQTAVIPSDRLHEALALLHANFLE